MLPEEQALSTLAKPCNLKQYPPPCQGNTMAHALLVLPRSSPAKVSSSSSNPEFLSAPAPRLGILKQLDLTG